MNTIYVPTIRLWQERKKEPEFKALHREINALRSIANANALRIPDTPVYVCLGQAAKRYQNNTALQVRLDEYFKTIEGAFNQLDDSKTIRQHYTIQCPYARVEAFDGFWDGPQSVVKAVLFAHRAVIKRAAADSESRLITPAQLSALEDMLDLLLCLPPHPITTLFSAVVSDGKDSQGLIMRALVWAGLV